MASVALPSRGTTPVPKPCSRGTLQKTRVAAPMRLETTSVNRSTNIRWHQAEVLRRDKERLLGQRGCIMWLTGATKGGVATWD